MVVTHRLDYTNTVKHGLISVLLSIAQQAFHPRVHVYVIGTPIHLLLK